MCSLERQGHSGKAEKGFKEPFCMFGACLLAFGRPQEDTVKHSPQRHLKSREGRDS